MLLLSLRSDKPEAELGLFEDQTQLEHLSWQAHRELSVTIHKQLESLLKKQGKTLHDLQGVVCYKGPGSFTGLRIGLSVANALAYSLNVPIITSSGQQWLRTGIDSLLQGKSDPIALPEYGAPVNITLPKK